MKHSTVAILGAGSWGTAVAIHMALCGHEVWLWGHHPQKIRAMEKERCNNQYLPNIYFPPSLHLTDDITKAINIADEVIVAVPSHAFTEVINQFPKAPKALSWLTKGIDSDTQVLLSDCVVDLWGPIPIAVISGPSFALEVAKSLPTAVVVAGKDDKHLTKVRNLLHHRHFRVYKSFDPIGVQICGAVKNVLAIACGISDGMNYGANAKAALITRGIAEMARLGMTMGAEQDTFMGLAGVGDLVLTCTDNQSRNRRFGLQLGTGAGLDEAEATIGQVVEGKHNAAQVASLANQHKIEMPITEEVHEIIQGNITAKKAAENLMHRPPKDE
jgi:glycerol-3-phosphate dehydrogenase (NAD(P)+)